MTATEQIDLNRLAALVRSRRGDKGLRAATEEIGGISAPTLSRIEQGNMPDLDTFARICNWLSIRPDAFFLKATDGKCSVSGEMMNSSKPPEKIEAFLRADRTLPPETIDALGRMIRLAYEHANKNGF
ncbi:MAG: helix-turn-helix domain-containing protein [Terrimicrobiaceae bacterium]